MKNLTLTAAKIAEIVKGQVVGDPERTITGVSGIREAKVTDLSFVGNKRYEQQLSETAAGIILVCADLANAEAENRTLIVCENVDYAFSVAVAMFAEEPPVWPVGIHPSAVVSPNAVIGEGVSINANAVIEDGAEIGDGAVIGAGCYIGHDAKVGAGTLLYPNVTIMFRCTVGRKCIIHPGVVIGGDGFGFIPGPQGLVKVPQTGFVQIDDDVEIGANTTMYSNSVVYHDCVVGENCILHAGCVIGADGFGFEPTENGYEKIPQIGNVILEDNVEIGANSCVDRAVMGSTIIRKGVKLDNLVQIGHNCEVGSHTVMSAQVGVAGSTKIG